ncbi:glycosyltransferase 87 family protein [Streptomyces sp. LP05-1]|uniref:Glycosyltransferase 87 family protein n=1 Tax=Streptomyces pyxinae TaxID=2970734 RepID=A0ABT2CL64_9ACTN|nr:glycosyltransferase 87 family protein [Streptomyces sp. LP05-1]MCS0638137.1 glycosyltransferase 87 family protein [Streptomyces sp. LP05-1]
MTVIVNARNRLRDLPLPAAAAVCLLSFAAFWAAQRAAHVTMLDLSVYRAEGETVLSGGDLYAMRATTANLPTTYPPFAALLFTPLTLLGVPEMRTVATAGNLLLLLALVRLSLRLVGRDRWVTALLAAAALVWCEPVWTTLRYGQINLLIAVAVLWDLTRRERNRWAGVGIGLATAVKLTPGLFVVLLLAVGLIRAREHGWNPWLRRAATATGVFVAVTVGSAVALPYDSRRFWTEMIYETGRVGRTEETANQSLSGVLARLLHTTDPGHWWLVAALLVGAGGLTVAVRAALRGDRAVAAVACGLTALLVSPISWSHHWVWCVPLLVLLAARPGRHWGWTAGTALVFASFALWWVPHAPAPVRLELHQNPGQMLLSALYTLLGLAVLGDFAVRLRAGDRGYGAGAGTAGTGNVEAGAGTVDARTGAVPGARRETVAPGPAVEAGGSGTGAVETGAAQAVAKE